MEEEVEEEEREEEMKSGKKGAQASSPGRKQEEGGQVVELENKGCDGYTEGTNCSGVRQGCCQHTSCQHTPGARHTHRCTHTPRPGPKCVNNPAKLYHHPSTLTPHNP